MDKLIEVINVCYGDLFQNLYLDIIKDEFLMITGSNSCGKTTLSKIISGSIMTKDNVLIDSQLINYYDKKDLCLLTSDCFLDDKLNKNEETLKLFKMFGKTSLLNSDNLSRGDLNLYNLLISLLKHPSILIIDDTLSSLDNFTKTKVLKYLKKVSKKEHMIIIYFTSNMDDLLYADTVAIIKDKKIEKYDNVEDLLKDENNFRNIKQDMPFMANLCTKLKYYGLVDKIILNKEKLVKLLWK